MIDGHPWEASQNERGAVGFFAHFAPRPQGCTTTEPVGDAMFDRPIAPFFFTASCFAPCPSVCCPSEFFFIVRRGPSRLPASASSHGR